MDYEGCRQAFGAIYLALAEAAGGEEILEKANSLLADVIDCEAIDDPDALCILESCIRASRPVLIDNTVEIV
jgi:hypothetical protein